MKRTMLTLGIAAVLLTACGGESGSSTGKSGGPEAQPLPRPNAPLATGPARILFVGNSHTEYYLSIPQLFQELCDFNHVAISAEKRVEMGIALDEVYAADPAKTAALLAQTDADGNYYDYVVLQERTPVVLDDADKYGANVKMWTDKLRRHSPGVAVWLYELASPGSYTEDKDEFEDYHATMRANTVATLQQAPNSGLYRVGDALKAAYEGSQGYRYRNGPNDRLRHGEESLHILNDGAFLATVLLYETLFGKRPQLPPRMSFSTGTGDNDEQKLLPVSTAVSNPTALANIAWQYH